MTLRKITIDIGVRYINKDGQSRSEHAPQNSKERMKNASISKLSQKNKKFIEKITGEGFERIK